jgi:hypothetical protein
MNAGKKRRTAAGGDNAEDSRFFSIEESSVVVCDLGDSGIENHVLSILPGE